MNAQEQEQEIKSLIKQGKNSLVSEELYRVAARLEELDCRGWADRFYKKANSLHVDHAESRLWA